MISKLWACALLSGAMAVAADVSPAKITFNKDVLPILQKNCQGCHRPGQIAPMSFLTYQSTRPWAKAMKAAVASRKMPPWFADPQVGQFANSPALKQSDVDVIVRWADSGALEGDAKDTPTAVQWPVEGWEIQPDIIVQGPRTKVPANVKANVFEWTQITVPGPFLKDTWVSSIEVRPGNRSLTHHIGVFFKPHTPEVVYNSPEWVDKPRDENGNEVPLPNGQLAKFTLQQQVGATFVGLYVPGIPAVDYRPFEAAKLIPAGSDFVFQVHYTPNGAAFEDQPLVGFTILKDPPKRQYIDYFISSTSDRDRFALPPNNANWQSPNAEATFTEDVELTWMMPHMHLRGKDQTWTLYYPDGHNETILNVPNYDFNWNLATSSPNRSKFLKVPSW